MAKSLCCVLQQKTLSAAYTGSTLEDPFRHVRKIVDWDVKKQNNQLNKQNWSGCKILCLFVCFVALRPKSNAMVMAGRSVHLTTLFLRQA